MQQERDATPKLFVRDTGSSRAQDDSRGGIVSSARSGKQGTGRGHAAGALRGLHHGKPAQRHALRWKLELIEGFNPEWADLYLTLNQ